MVGSGQKWGDIDLTITPPKLLAKLAAEVHRNCMDNKHNVYLAEKGATEPGEDVDWGLVVRTKATTPSAKGLLLQGVCDVLTTRAWMWDRGIAEDRRTHKTTGCKGVRSPSEVKAQARATPTGRGRSSGRPSSTSPGQGVRLGR